MKVLFLGSSRFSRIVLEKMLENGVNVVGVITQPDRPSGRGHKLTPTEIKVFAKERNIKVYDFDRLRLHMEEVKEIDYDISVVASYGQIIPDSFLEHRLCINVHPSLLPKYRGASPLQSAILNGDSETGVTIMKVASEVDAGDIILKQKYPLNNESYLALEEKLALLGGEMTIEALDLFEKGKMTFSPQDHTKATLTCKFKKEDGRLDFNESSDLLARKVRAFGEEMGCYFNLGENAIKVEDACKANLDKALEIGEILNDKKHFIIGCKEGALEILACKSPSGKRISGRDFLNGHNELLGKNIYDIK